MREINKQKRIAQQDGGDMLDFLRGNSKQLQRLEHART